MEIIVAIIIGILIIWGISFVVSHDTFQEPLLTAESLRALFSGWKFGK